MTKESGGRGGHILRHGRAGRACSRECSGRPVTVLVTSWLPLPQPPPSTPSPSHVAARPPRQLAASAASSNVCRKADAHCRIPATSTTSQLVFAGAVRLPLTARLSTDSVSGVTSVSTSVLCTRQ